MAFVTIGGLSQYISSGMAAEAILAAGVATTSTAHEAAQCVSRLCLNGDPLMNEANEDFKRIYGNALSTSEVKNPVPNQAMKDFTVGSAMREGYEISDQFAHLFDENGAVK